VSQMAMLFAGTLTAVNSCMVNYDAGLGVAQLLTNDGSAWTGGVYPGTPSSISNSKCTLYGAGSSVSTVGNTVTLTLNLTFVAGFGGGQPLSIWLAANDGRGTSGWVPAGTWQPPASVAVAVSPLSVTRLAGQMQQFTAQVTGTSNPAVNWTLSPSDWWVGGKIATNGNYTAPAEITYPLAVTVTARSQADPTKSATATVTLQPSTAPFLYGIVPNQGTGHRTLFSFNISTSNIPLASIEPFLGNTGTSGPGNGVNACHVKYLSSTGRIYLDGDSGGSSWSAGSSYLGEGADFSNSTCIIHPATSALQPQGGGDYNLVLDIEFKAAAAGQTKGLYFAAENTTGAVANFQYFGTYTPN